MNINFKTILTASLALLVSATSFASEPLFSTSITTSDKGELILSNRGANDIKIYSTDMELLREFDLGSPATSVVAIGDKLYATTDEGAIGYLHCLDAQSGAEIFKSKMGNGATGASVSVDSKKIYVCNRYDATVSEVDAASGTVLREVKVLREPIGVVSSPNGKFLFVANFLPSQRADIDIVAADVSVIETKKFTKVKDIKLDNGSNALRGITISDDGQYIYVSHNLGRYQVPTSQLQQGWMNTSAVSVIDVKEQKFIAPILLDDSDHGAAGVWGLSSNDDYIVVAQSGTHDISIVKHNEMRTKLEAYEDPTALSYDLYFMRDIRRRIKINGNGPRYVTLLDGKAYVTTYFSDIVNIVDLESGDVESVNINPDRVESRINQGERIFNDAKYCYQNWQSCNGCHPGEARTDAMNWDLMNDGIGNPKSCKSMLYSHETNPSMISGIRASADLAVRKGFTHIQLSSIEEEEAIMVDEYLRALVARPSPFLVDGELSERAKKGKVIFDQMDCGRCHNGKYYTDQRMHRIGEDVEFEAGWDTPTLCEVWRTAPYLFDGRAATMKEVYSVHKHGITGSISEEDATNLAEYVNSL